VAGPGSEQRFEAAGRPVRAPVCVEQSGACARHAFVTDGAFLRFGAVTLLCHRGDAVSRAPSKIVTQRHARIRYLRLVGARAVDELERKHRAVCDAYSDDALHDVRVAARRVRALLELVGSRGPTGKRRKADKAVRRILKATRTLRDADVQADRIARRFARVDHGSERAALEHLMTILEARRLRRREKALAKLQELPIIDVSLSVRDAIVRGVRRLEKHGGSAWPAFVHASVHASLGRALVPMPDVDDDVAVECLHAMRVATKRLRYTLDLVRPLLDQSATEVFETLKVLQRLLGDHHDLALLAQRVKKELPALERAGSTLIVEGIEHELGRIARERKKVFQALRQALVSEEQSELRHRIDACLPQLPSAGPGLKTAHAAPVLKVASGS
jgi:CHAD domain-containing protein